MATSIRQPSPGRRLFSLGTLASGGLIALPPRPQAAFPDRVSTGIDFSAPAPCRSMNGFLNSIHPEDPPAERIRHLAPALWRSNELRQHDAIRSWGAKFESVLSDGWGYPLEGSWKPPHEYPAAWDAFVRRIAEVTRGKEIYWDIWNEPDTRGSWRGPREAFFATWVRAAQILRQTLGPDTMIGGPSTSSFQPAFFDAFLTYCQSARCKVNFLCWHELEPWSDIALVARNARNARRDYVDTPRFRALGLTEIHVNEYVGEVDQYRPAELLAFLFYLEHGGADFASRSCWGRHCEDNSIDGIIDAATRQPRAAWWIHALYAAGCEHRVRSVSDYGHVVVIAQALPAGSGQVQALIGYYGHEGATAARLPVDVRLTGLSHVAKGRRVRVKLLRIPDVGPQTVTALPVLSEQVLQVVDDQVAVALNGLAIHEACAIRVEEA